MLAFAIIAGVLLLIFIFIYNSLVGKKNQVENAFSSIDTMLKKRYDLIPNLVSTVKTYMSHEKDVLNKITELRSKAVSGQLSSDEKVDIDNQLSRAVRGIMVSVENYPDLKASQNFLQLQASWNEVEEQISASRRSFNASVTDYNNSVEMFPSNIVAKIISYSRKKVFEIPEEERKNISAKELFAN